jgi:hypothetical protein
LTTHAGVELLCLLHCAKMRKDLSSGHFLPEHASTMKLTIERPGIGFAGPAVLCFVLAKPI